MCSAYNSDLLELNKIKTYFIKLDKIFWNMYNICDLPYIIHLNKNPIYGDYYFNTLTQLLNDVIFNLDNINCELEKETNHVLLSIKEIINNIKNAYLNFLTLEKKAQMIKIKLDSVNTVILYDKNKYNYLFCNLEITVHKLMATLSCISSQTNILVGIFKTHTDNLILLTNYLDNSPLLPKQLKFYIDENHYFTKDELYCKWYSYIRANRLPTFIQSLIQDVELMYIKAYQNNDKESVFKLEKQMFALNIFIRPYIDIMENKLFVITSILKISSLSKFMYNLYIDI